MARKITKLMIFVLLMATLSMIFIACGEDTEAEMVVQLKEDDTYEITQFNKYKEKSNVTINPEDLVSLEIPDSYNGKKITSIADHAFLYCNRLKSIIIPQSITSIGTAAFTGCPLESVYYQGDISDWCNIVFAGNDSNPLVYAHNLYINNELVEEITIPDAMTEIKKYAFMGWNGTSVTVGNNVSEIGAQAFRDCTELKSVSLGSNVKTIGANAFLNCQIETASIPAFAFPAVKNDNIKTVEISSGEVIKEYVYSYQDCPSLVNLTIGDTITDIARYAFKNCTGLKNVTIGKNVVNIGEDAFAGCPIETANVPSNMISPIKNNALRVIVITVGTGISDSALEGCVNLESVTIPDSIKTVGKDVLKNCNNIKAIWFNGTATQWKAISFADDTVKDSHKLYLNGAWVLGEWTNQVLPTCTGEGALGYYVCAVCGKYFDENINVIANIVVDALGHDTIHHEGKDSTCTESGWKEYDTCSRCDYTTYEETSALGHDFIHHDARPVTCTEIGWDAYDTCSRCDYTTYEEIPALYPELGHDLVHHAAKEATCTENGWNAYDTCSRCPYTTYREIPASHDFGEWITTVAPTCISNGEKARTCIRCGATETSLIEKSGHAYVFDSFEWNNYDAEAKYVCEFDSSHVLLKDAHIESEITLDPEGDNMGIRTYTATYEEESGCVRTGRKEKHFYELIINYVFEGGAKASDSVYRELERNETYAYNSPEIEGMTVSESSVSGSGVTNREVTVIYYLIEADTIDRLDAVDLGNVPYNTQFSELALPKKITGYTEMGRAVELSVVWSATGYRATSCGRGTINGTVFATYGFDFACSTAVCATYNLVENIIVSVNEMNLGKLPLNTRYEGLGLPTTASVLTSTGATAYLPVVWNTYEYDSSVIGSHVIMGTVLLEDGFQFGAGVSNRATITFELSEGMLGTADIVFIIDTTGSMWDEIQNVKNNINAFATELEELGVSVRWALLEYRDITCDGAESTKIVYCGSSEWYIDVDSYKRAIGSLHVDGGGDREETVIDALAAAMLLENREDAHTFYIVVTDADYKVNNRYGVSNMAEMIERLTGEEIITSVVTETRFYNDYRLLTNGTGGILANIDGNFRNELFKLTDLFMDTILLGRLISIEIKESPVKTEYYSGDYFDGTGMVVVAKYDSGLEREVNAYSVIPATSIALTDTEIIVNYRGKEASVAITVCEPEHPVTGVTITPSTITLIEGERATIQATVSPFNATNKEVVYYTSNPNVAAVKGNVVYAWEIGQARITAVTADGGYTAELLVTVIPAPIRVEGIFVSVGSIELSEGESTSIAVTILPEDATDKTLVWATVDAEIATVEGGVITARSSGTTTITVRSVDGGHTAAIFVTVLERFSESFAGRVYKADNDSDLSNNQKLSDVRLTMVKYYRDGTTKTFTATTNTNGEYVFRNLPYGEYVLTAEKTGYISNTENLTINRDNIQNGNILLVSEESLAPGIVKGYAQDARTAGGISGITVYVRRGTNNVAGESVGSFTTGSGGAYTTPSLTAGNYTLQFVDERTLSDETYRYTSGSINIAVTANATINNQNIVLSNNAAMNVNSMRIVLTWGSTPSDLDSHLTIAGSSTSYHIYYGDKTLSGAQANLDVDDTTSYGPETITITSIKDNFTYTYYVHNFSGGSNSELSNSGAVVKIYLGSTLYGEFNVPNGSGMKWTLFRYNKTTGFEFINTIN